MGQYADEIVAQPSSQKQGKINKNVEVAEGGSCCFGMFSWGKKSRPTDFNGYVDMYQN